MVAERVEPVQQIRFPPGFADVLDRVWVIGQPDPVVWINKHLPRRHLWSKQQEIVQSLRDNRRTAVRSCHGVGKSFIAATIACWWASAFPIGEALVVSTAPTAAQVGTILWHEIRNAHREGSLPGRVGLDNVWKASDGTEVGIGRKPSDHNEHSFQGLHRKRVLVIADEACGIASQLWTAFEAIATNEHCRLLAIGNPDDPSTEFAKMCKPGSGWNVITISAFDSPNLTGEEVPAAMRDLLVSREWVEDKAKRWGTSSPRYQSKVLGQFPEIGNDTLIPPAWIERAQLKEIVPDLTRRRLAVDVARYGSDSTVVGLMSGGHFRVLETLQFSATTETTGLAIRHALANGNPDITVDGVGVGSGVVDELREAKREGRINGHVRDFQGGEKAGDPKEYVNARAEAFWNLRTMFQDDEIDIDPADDELAAQLGAIKYKYDSRGRVAIETKDEMKERGLPSPDRADTLAMAASMLGRATAPVVTVGGMTRRVASRGLR